MLFLSLVLFAMKSSEAITLLLFSPIFILLILYLIYKKYWNDIYISMGWMSPGGAHHAITGNFLFFSNRHLSKKDIKSKEIKRKGLYIVISPKRVKYILSLYDKEVEVLEWILPLGKAVEINRMIEEHNKSVREKQKVQG